MFTKLTVVIMMYVSQIIMLYTLNLIQDESQVLKLKLWLKTFQQTKAQDQMASQVNSIKHLEKS